MRLFQIKKKFNTKDFKHRGNWNTYIKVGTITLEKYLTIVGVFSHYCNKISDRNNLWEERFIAVLSFKVFPFIVGVEASGTGYT